MCNCNKETKTNVHIVNKEKEDKIKKIMDKIKKLQNKLSELKTQ